ncbi:expressed unknown protein [Seminavis robusta]|uniref:Uncharacterized protein n=1 Tax=Seminavis robusta TaxID=568900 RepID=A0A9N8DQ91_9STRA|nr:expressed unknown protein [Seminavis robusta]|eukprot:Sro181_g079110.1 n/a (340) ;mRNA; f:52885-53904
MTSSSILVGLLCASGSAVFNGSFTSLFKTEKMRVVEIHPMVFQLYVCQGIFLSSFLVVPFLSFNESIQSDFGTAFQLSGMGMVAGFLFVVAVSASFLAVNDIGVALAQGIWGGGAMLVSYLWGVLVFGEIPSKPLLSFTALLVLIAGVIAVAFSETIGEKLFARLLSSNESTPLVSATADGNSTVAAESSPNCIRGVLWANLVGLSGGSILAPLHYVPPAKQGLVFLPSFGIGTFLLSPMFFLAFTRVTREVPPLHWKEALTTGICSGLIWNLGNLLSIIAIPAIGYGVAYPIMQCAILVSGLWGILVFREITKPTTIRVFWIGGIVLVLGGSLLAMAQ